MSRFHGSLVCDLREAGLGVVVEVSTNNADLKAATEIRDAEKADFEKSDADLAQTVAEGAGRRVWRVGNGMSNVSVFVKKLVTCVVKLDVRLSGRARGRGDREVCAFRSTCCAARSASSRRR